MFIGSAIVLVLLIGVGVAYIWYMGQQEVDPNAIASKVDYKPVETKKPVKEADNVNVGASIQSLTSPVSPGSNVSVVVNTNQESQCTISVIYDKTESKDSGLLPKKSDEYGMVSWTWTVENSVPLGKWPVKVTCSKGTKSGVVVGDLVIAKP